MRSFSRPRSLTWTAAFLMALGFVTGACSKDEGGTGSTVEEKKKGEKTGKDTPRREGSKALKKPKDKKKGAPRLECKEETGVSVSIKEGDVMKPIKPFEFKKGVAWIQGQWINGKAVAKQVSVALANYDVKMGRYMIRPPKEAGQVAVVVSMHSAAKEVPFEKQKATYKALALPKGRFELKRSMLAKHLNITVWRGNQPGRGQGFTAGKGGAEITKVSPHKVCGTVSFTSAKGSKIEGAFAMPISRDTWK